MSNGFKLGARQMRGSHENLAGAGPHAVGNPLFTRSKVRTIGSECDLPQSLMESPAAPHHENSAIPTTYTGNIHSLSSLPMGGQLGGLKFVSLARQGRW